MASQSVIIPSKLDIERISLANAKNNTSKSTKFYINYDNKRFSIETPQMFSVFDASESKTMDGRIYKYSISLSFGKEEYYSENKELSSLLKFGKELDNLVLKIVENNSNELFGQEMSVEELKKKYYPLINHNEESGYPPRIRLDIPIFNGKIDTKMFIKDPIEELNIKDYIKHLKGIRMKAIFKVTNIWINGEKFGLSTSVDMICISSDSLTKINENIECNTNLNLDLNIKASNCSSSSGSECGKINKDNYKSDSDDNKSDFSSKFEEDNNDNSLKNYQMITLDD